MRSLTALSLLTVVTVFVNVQLPSLAQYDQLMRTVR